MRSKAEIEADVPCLVGKDYEPASCKTMLYNCFAWAHGETVGWLDPAKSPGNYWPDGVPRQRSIDAYVQAYAEYGFECCDNDAPEDGFEKIAIFLDEYDEPSHAARLRDSGMWTSKLGGLDDIEHERDALVGPEGYGVIARYMKRRV